MCEITLLGYVVSLCNYYLAFSPVSPDRMKWKDLYPAFFDESNKCSNGRGVEFADVGCGYGGLLGK